MTRLGLLMFLSIGVAIPGALIIVVLAFGFVNAGAVVAAGLVGLALALPASQWIARQTKAQDPEWDELRERARKAPPGARPDKI